MELSRVIREFYSYRKPEVQTSFGFFQPVSKNQGERRLEAHCVLKKGFARNQDVTVKLKTELFSIRF